MRKNILLAGFEPFGGETVNPAWESVKALDGLELIPGYVVVAKKLPCIFDKVRDVLMQAMRTVDPHMVIAVGQASGRSGISFERVAINVDDARIEDNAGQQPIDTPVELDGPVAYFSTLPIKAMMQALLNKGIPANISNTAGTFVCNHIFYAMMHSLRNRAEVRAGFIHVPCLPGQTERPIASPSMPLEQMIAALITAIQIAITTEDDLPVAAGALH